MNQEMVIKQKTAMSFFSLKKGITLLFTCCLLLLSVITASAQTTITKQVASGSDDAEQKISDGSVNVTGSSDLEMVKDGSNNQIVGIRFTGLNIPVGATITNAYFTFTADEDYSVSTSLVIKAQAADNASSFSTSTNNISNRTTTSESFAWNNIPAWTNNNVYTSPNISNVVQEVVNRGGWVSGNSMVFIITGSGTRNTDSYDGSPSTAVKITITYTTTPANCTCPGNMVANPSFESGTTSWGSSGGTLSAGTGAVKCGSKSGDFQISNNSNNWVTQTIGTNLPIGTTLNASVYAGTHDNSFYHQVFIQFFDANWNWISSVSTEVNKVLANSPTGPQLYNLTAVVPANTKYTQVGYSGNGNWIKTDMWCVTSTPPASCNPDDATAANGTSFCAPAPVCASGNFSWSQSINNSNGTPSIVRLIAGSTNSYIIPVGTYPTAFSGPVTVTVTDVVSYDGYATRNTVTQTNERWRIVFKKAGNTVASTPYTTDVPDLRKQGYWRGSLGTAISLPNGTDQIIIEHIDLNSNNGPGSVVPVSVCISYTAQNTGSIGDRVWLDANGNGLQDASETAGLTGITVKLRNSSNTVIATTTTNGSGNYLFSGLVAGNYTVEFPVSISGAIVTTQHVGTNVNIDSDPSQTTGITQVINLAAGQNITNIDAGYCPVNLSLGNRVWYDTNNDGINNGENGISNVTVYLYKDDNNDNIADGASIATELTDADGFFMFTNLGPGNYIIGAVMPAGYMSSSIDGGDPDNDINLDDNGMVFVGNEVRGLAITLIAGTEPTGGGNENITYDFGMLPDCSCTNSASNLLVNASFENGTTGWSWSSANGSLTTGTGYVACGAKNGFNNQSSGTSKVWQDVTVAAGANVSFTAFAGTHAPGINCSPTLSLIFLNSSNAVISQSDVIVTRIVGDNHDQLEQYSINAVAPTGTVKVRVQSSITCNTMKLDAFCLTASSIPGSIGDRVWVDTDKNGVQNAGEVGLGGVVVTLYDNTTNNVLASTVTDGLGNYKFSNLPTGAAGSNYQVRFSLIPGYRFSPVTGAISSATNSDASVTTGRTATITLTNAAPNVTYVDAGVYYTEMARIGDFVWNDINKNGIQDAGEPGIAGVTVMLYTSGDVLFRSTVTSSSGYYSFSDILPPGSYYIKVAPPIGYQVSPKDQTADNLDSDIDPVTWKTPNFSVVAGTNNLTLDAGLNVTNTTGPSASLGDKVWNDINNNNLQDANEPGVPNATVQLYSSSNVLLATTTTDAFGKYIFNGLTPGSYYVKFTLPGGYSFVTQNEGSDDNIDSDADAAGMSHVVTLIADEINISVDAGVRLITAAASLGDYVWYDLNKNGTQDGGAEVGAPGISVVLYNSSNAVVATTTTDANGFYLFTGLPASTTYTVGFENIPAGYGFSPNNFVITVANNSDVNPFTGRTGNVTTGTAGSTISYVDAGLIAKPNNFDSKSSVGDKVWNDLNNNGIQDAGEPGLAGVTVTLYAANGTTVLATTTTNALGNYLFTNLDAGSYVIGFSMLPSGYDFVAANAGADDSKDSDADLVTGKTAPFSLAAGEINLSIDAGARNTTAGLSAIGNYVWYDANSNGIQDAGEAGAMGVSVALKNAANTVIKTTTTSATGFYLFTDLAAGTYTVQFGNLPSGYVATTKNAAGSNATNNSDANVSTLATDPIVLAANTTDLTWDMGIRSTTRGLIGDFVWSDANGNGIQDAGEPGIAGVTVTLYDNANNAIATTVTDANGYYTFSNVVAGTYSIGFTTIPASSAFTTQNASGSTAANNSDVNPATGRTATFTLTAGQAKTDIDAGLVSYKAAVGDYVWFDANRDGIQDANEPGVPGVTVTMYTSTDAIIGNGDDVAVASAVTDAEGYYFINNVSVVPAGSRFYMRYTDVQSDYNSFTTPLVGGAAAANNSKVTTQLISEGRSGFFTLNPNQVYRDMDAGVVKQINISGHVWNDANGLTDLEINQTGTQAIPNSLVVYLVDINTNQIVQAESINLDGTYSFLDVEVNHSYKIVLSTVVAFPGDPSPIPFLPSGWQRVGENLGAGPLSGSDGVPNGQLFIDTETSNVFEANFGIRISSGEIIVG